MILNFLPIGKFHWFSKKRDKHSNYTVLTYNGFYSILGSNPDSVKRAVVYIPVSSLQKQKFDSIASAYLKQSPYDYALFGMRCGAAAYEILSQLGILPTYSNSKTYKKIFYPKKLRERLFTKAIDKDWAIVFHQGTYKRKWEKD